MSYPLLVNGGGSAAFVNASMNATPGAILVGPTGSRAGLVIGLRCRLVADPSSPWRLSALGDIDRKPKRDLRDEDWVHLLPEGGDFEVLRGLGRLFGEQVRIVYAGGE